MPEAYLHLIFHLHPSLSGILSIIIRRVPYISFVFILKRNKDQDYLIVTARDHFFIGTDNGIFNLILNAEPDEVVKIEHKGSKMSLKYLLKLPLKLFRERAS